MCTENYHWHHDYVRLAWDSGFSFDIYKSKCNLDWSSIGLVDVDRVTRDRDIAAVEKHITTILHFTLDEEHTKILDPTFVKIFQLGQLSLQYLQFCKKYLDNTVVLLKKEVAKFKEENAKLKECVNGLKTEIANLKKKLKDLKSAPQCQPQHPELLANVKCSECMKVFLNEEFLAAHVKRRHDVNPLQMETDKLQLEIKELKERLNSTEKYIQSDHNLDVNKSVLLPNNNLATIENFVQVTNLQDKFEHLKQHVERELNVLRDQKQYEDKYEKWFEMVFERLDNSKRELQEKENRTELKESVAVGVDKIESRDICTQTVPEVTSQPQVERFVPKVPEYIVKPAIEVDVQKIQEDIRINTENQLGQIQDVLQQKLSGGLEQIQTQMNTFWKKINDLETEKVQMKAKNTSDDTTQSKTECVEVPATKPQPAPRAIKPPTVVQSRTSRKEGSYTSHTSRPTTQTSYDDIAEMHAIDDELEHGLTTDSSAIVEQVRDLRESSAKRLRSKARSQDVPARSHVTRKGDVAKVSGSAMYTGNFAGKIALGQKKARSLRGARSFVQSSDNELSTDGSSCVAKPQVKPSNTSTLAQRSLTSLKQALQDDIVLVGLKGQLQDMVNLRLREIGVSPNWKGLPLRSYRQAQQLIAHQANLTAKKYPNYTVLREEIVKDIEVQIKQLPKETPKPKHAVQRSIDKHTKLPEKNRKRPIHKSRRSLYQKAKEGKTLNDTYNVDVDNSENISHQENNRLSRTYVVNKDVADVPVLSNDEIVPKNTGMPAKSQTPIKKKVLFDLETSSSNSAFSNRGLTQVYKVSNTTEQDVQKQAEGDNLSHYNGRAATESFQVKESMELTSLNINDKKKIGMFITKHIDKTAEGQNKDDQEKKITTKRNFTPLKINAGGSSTTIDSSVLDGPIVQADVRKEITNEKSIKSDVSDWDISDILI